MTLTTNTRSRKTTGLKSILAVTAVAAIGAGTLTGCQSDAQTGLVGGMAAGALAGQAIGKDTEGTLLGTAIGGAAGYIIGNESDKARDRNYRSDDW